MHTVLHELFVLCLETEERKSIRNIKNVGAITPHAFGDHQLCGQRVCKYLEDPSTYKHKSLPFGKDLTDASLRTELITEFEKYTAEAMLKKDVGIAKLKLQ